MPTLSLRNCWFLWVTLHYQPSIAPPSVGTYICTHWIMYMNFFLPIPHLAAAETKATSNDRHSIIATTTYSINWPTMTHPSSRLGRNRNKPCCMQQTMLEASWFPVQTKAQSENRKNHLIHQSVAQSRLTERPSWRCPLRFGHKSVWIYKKCGV